MCLRRGVVEHEVLDQKLDVADATAPVLEIEMLCVAAIKLGAHFLTHRNDVGPELVTPHALDKGLAPDTLELGRYRRTARDRAGAQQRLVLPGPCVFVLVAFKRIGIGNQQAFMAIGSESRIDFVQLSGAGLHRQQVH